MKKLFFFFLLSFAAVSLSAQIIIDTRSRPKQRPQQRAPQQSYKPEIQITPTIGYQTEGSIDFIEGNFRYEDNLSFGGIISTEIRRDVWLELQYTRMNTDARFRRYLSSTRTYYDMSVDYFQIGARKSIQNNNNVDIFGSYSLGATLFNIKDSGINDVWRFSMTFGLGAIFYMSETVGFRFQSRLLMPMYFEGGGLFVGIGSGGPSGGVGLTSTTTVIQGDFSFGMVFRLGQ